MHVNAGAKNMGKGYFDLILHRFIHISLELDDKLCYYFKMPPVSTHH